MWSEESIKQAVRNYISRFFQGHSLMDGEDMFATGFVNSLFAMQLVQFAESTFGINVESEDLEIDNFRSVNALTRFVQQKQSS